MEPLKGHGDGTNIRWEGKNISLQKLLRFSGERKHFAGESQVSCGNANFFWRERKSVDLFFLLYNVPLGAPYLCSLSAFICSKYSLKGNIVNLIAI